MSSSYRYTLLPDATLSSERFVSEALEKQKLLIDGQDRDLEKVGDSVSILRNMSHKIGDELDDHAVILDELGTEMEQTSARIDGLVKKIARISNLNDVAPMKCWNAFGFVLYCPCMGRFGNQIEQLLGVITFARTLNRTLVLPPFIEYQPQKHEARMVEFDRYFSLTTFNSAVSVITMRMFMENFAESVWPIKERKAFCWRPRRSIFNPGSSLSCHAKEGNPFGPFWNNFNVDFVGDIYYGMIVQQGRSIVDESSRDMWNEKFPVLKYPVISFVSAPAAFPVLEKDVPNQRFLLWNVAISNQANKFIDEYLERPFIGIHLRNGLDWDRVCDHIGDNGTVQILFASAQCMGYGDSRNILTKEMCLPSLPTILYEVENQVNRTSARSVFVSSDLHHYLDELQRHLSYAKINVIRFQSNDVHVNLAILGKSDHFIGNCVSTFSSFVVRERHYTKRPAKPSSFFASPMKSSQNTRTEL